MGLSLQWPIKYPLEVLSAVTWSLSYAIMNCKLFVWTCTKQYKSGFDKENYARRILRCKQWNASDAAFLSTRVELRYSQLIRSDPLQGGINGSESDQEGRI